MNKVFLAFATTVALCAMAACSGSANKEQNQAGEDGVETILEDDVYNPPFEISYSFEFEDYWTYRNTVTVQVLKNGKLKGMLVVEQRKGYYPDYRWEENKTEEFTGKWSTTHISMGDGYQKVYALDYSYTSSTAYMPNDCEYIWICKNAYMACENYEINRAVKIKEVNKL
ncbi:MAG: hypothetical protein NC343_01345 [Muribaculum sp.]|nr:hypothetical protein [Muribaculaceae bacterium]MCM1080381.1 hypothetical protein [Muribaculum sp.]